MKKAQKNNQNKPQKKVGINARNEKAKYSDDEIARARYIDSKAKFPAKNEQPYILQAVDHIGFFVPHTVILGWYENEESVKMEMEEILSAMNEEKNMYKLQYFTDVKISALGTASRK